MPALSIFIIIFALPFFFRELRQKHSILLVYFVVVLLHQIVVFVNVFVFTIPGAEADAVSFNRIGMELAQSGDFVFTIGSGFYSNMLGVAYWIFGDSHLLGSQLSILAFALSCVIFVKMQRIIGLNVSALALLIFGALPTMVILGSITLRESYQILFFMLSVYFGIKMQLKGGINFYIFALMGASLIMGLFHQGLIAYAFFLIFFLMFFSLYAKKTKFNKIRKIHLLVILLLPVLMALMFYIVETQWVGGSLSALVEGDVLSYSQTYREHSNVTRATYGVEFDSSSIYSAFYSSAILYVYYLFSPFVWQASNFADAYAALEAIIRVVLLYYSIKHWRQSIGVKRRILGLMLVLFFTMSFMWAMGTSNYGTAIRHHMLTWWIVVLTGSPLLVQSLRSFLSKSLVIK